MLTEITDYQLAWHPERGGRCRYKLASEAEWSEWLSLSTADYLLPTMLLSRTPVFYDQLTGTVVMVPLGTSEALDTFGEEQSVSTPNSGDDSAAAAEDDQATGAPELLTATTLAGLRHRPWRAARALLKLQEQVNLRYPHRNRKSDGTIGDEAHEQTNSDHNPNILDGEYWVVTALDITHDPINGCDAGQLAAAIVASRDSRVKYLIWNRRIINSSTIGGQSGWTWRDYSGENPHKHHIHISVKANKAAYDGLAPWTLPQQNL